MNIATSALLLLALTKAAHGGHSAKTEKHDISMSFKFGSKSAKLAKSAKSLKEPIRRTLVDELEPR